MKAEMDRHPDRLLGQQAGGSIGELYNSLSECCDAVGVFIPPLTDELHVANPLAAMPQTPDRGAAADEVKFRAPGI
jgi:hypothetical protein